MTGVAGAMLGGTPTAHAQILTNGGFEQPSAVFQEIPAGDPSLTGWTVVNGSVEVIGNSIWDSFEGSQSIDLDGISAGTIEQTFATTPGTTYSLSFAYGNNPFGGATIPAFANVSVTGTATLLNNFFSHSSSDPFGSPMNYNTFFDTFVADSSLTTLRFTSLDAAGSNGGIALDAVSVQVATAAPEPGSIALAACSALPLAGMVIRRRRRSA